MTTAPPAVTLLVQSELAPFTSLQLPNPVMRIPPALEDASVFTLKEKVFDPPPELLFDPPLLFEPELLPELLFEPLPELLLFDGAWPFHFGLYRRNVRTERL